MKPLVLFTLNVLAVISKVQLSENIPSLDTKVNLNLNKCFFLLIYG